MDKKMEKLLKLLQDDAKLTVQELAVMLDMTEAEVAAAIHKFEKDGVIKGYRTLINWERTDVHRASALIELRVTPKKDSGFDELAARVKAFPEVESVCLMSGGFDLAVTVTANTMSEIAMFVAKRLAPIDGVLSTATHFILTKYKDGGVDFVTDPANLDAAAELIAGQEIVASAEIAKAALPQCGIVFLTGQEMKDAASGFLSVLYEADPQSVGGTLPDDNLYYIP